MRKLALLRVLFGVAALLLLLAVGSAAAEDMAPAAEDEVVVEVAPAGLTRALPALSAEDRRCQALSPRLAPPSSGINWPGCG